jgi:glycogen debranching enzyme
MNAARRSLAALSALAVCAALSCSKTTSPAAPGAALRLSALGVEVPAAASRAFIHTDKGDAYFYGEAAGPQQSSWQGLNVRGFTFVDDWHWTAGGVALGSDHFAGASVFPERVVRRYTGGFSEELTLLDGQRALLVEPAGAGPLVLRPLLSDSAQASYYQVVIDGSALCIARANHLTQSGPDDHPVWLVVKAAGATATADALLVAAGGLKPRMMGPGSLTLAAATPVVFAVGATQVEALANADAALSQAAALKAARAARMQALLDDTFVRTADLQIDRALAWVRLSMDALVMSQQGKGIFAGIPWFNNYWGRDTFITLGGSHLATGRWEEAKEILLSFSAHQDINPDSATYGRIPNIVSLGGVAYNTADGTPWFVLQAAEYVKRSGDAAFAAAIWPVLKLATDGELGRADASGFARHGDQETWMDATGPAGPYTPRGDRAVEIEGLWYQQLLGAAAVADVAGQTADAARYRAAAKKVSDGFVAAYGGADGKGLFDRLKPDGSKDAQVRPNQLLALRSLGALYGDQLPALTRYAAEQVAFQYGVASLSPADINFHPYHIYPGQYPKDSAYHNGVIWPWLSGPLVSLMTAQGAGEKAWEQLASLDQLAMASSTVGTLPELLDALPRLKPGVQPLELGTGPALPAGTPFQAWSHGEYLRNVWEDFVGVQYLAADHVLLQPKIPQAWGAATAKFRVGAGRVTVTIQPGPGRYDVTLSADSAVPASTVVTLGGLGITKDVPLGPGQRASGSVARVPTLPGAWAGFEWRKPALDRAWLALKPPPFIVLTQETIKQAPGADVKRIAVIDDPAGDDKGPPGESYTYPTDPHFLPGIFDFTHLEVREDSGAFYFALSFANLTDPHWNTQDGFQLTYAALLFDLHQAGGATDVGHNASYTLPGGGAWHFAIYIGAGLEVANAAGSILAYYTPQAADVTDPLGSVDTKQITFRIPKAVIPALPSGTSITVLAGSQDDYGNGSLGDFRKVDTVAGQWLGGGKANRDDANVYDFASGTVE